MKNKNIIFLTELECCEINGGGKSGWIGALIGIYDAATGIFKGFGEGFKKGYEGD